MPTAEPESVRPPTVSVLMPVRDGADHLRAAVDSVLAQDFRDFELLCVDDGSVDATPEILRQAAARDGRVRGLRGGGGLVAALNLGLGQCRGTFIARMDADDLCRSDRLGRQVDYLRRHPATGVLGGQIRCFGPGARRQYRYPTTHEAIQAAAIFECPVAHPTVMFRAGIAGVGQGPYDAAFRHCEDYELWTRWLEAGIGFAALDEVVLDYRVHPAQVGATQSDIQTTRADALRLRWLRRMGIEPSPRELELHRQAGQARWGRGLAYLRELEAWLRRLMEAEKRVGFPASAEFEAAVAQRWVSALWANRDLGAPLRRLLGEAWADLPHPQPWKRWAVQAASFFPWAKGQ